MHGLGMDGMYLPFLPRAYMTYVRIIPSAPLETEAFVNFLQLHRIAFSLRYAVGIGFNSHSSPSKSCVSPKSVRRQLSNLHFPYLVHPDLVLFSDCITHNPILPL